MKILSFDTSSDILSVAVFDKDRQLAFVEQSADTSHAEKLIPAIQKALKSSRLKLEKINFIGVGLGPGSFTGLRIGVTTAKILAYALKIKLIGVSSLEAVARSMERDGSFAVIQDARRSQVYAAVYERKNKRWKTRQKPALFMRECFLKSLKPDVAVLDSMHPTASAIAAVSRERIIAGKSDNPFSLTPLYLRPKDCNATRP